MGQVAIPALSIGKRVAKCSKQRVGGAPAYPRVGGVGGVRDSDLILESTVTSR